MGEIIIKKFNSWKWTHINFTLYPLLNIYLLIRTGFTEWSLYIITKICVSQCNGTNRVDSKAMLERVVAHGHYRRVEKGILCQWSGLPWGHWRERKKEKKYWSIHCVRQKYCHYKLNWTYQLKHYKFPERPYSKPVLQLQGKILPAQVENHWTKPLH